MFVEFFFMHLPDSPTLVYFNEMATRGRRMKVI
jgi:hypothetical protein